MIDFEKFNNAVKLTSEGNFKEAEKLYNEMLEENPNNGALLSAYGLFFVSQSDYKKAIVYLSKACEIEETFGTVSALGQCFYEQNRYVEAIKVFERALELGENADIYTKLLNCLFSIEEYGFAKKYAEIMYEKYPTNPNAVANIVKSLAHTGKMLEAEKICVDYLKEHTESPALWLQLGYLKELIYCDDKQACECYKLALERGALSANYSIATSYSKQGKFEKAELYFEKMLELYPNDKDTIASFAMCKLTQKKFKEGQKLFFERPTTPIDEMTNNPWKPGDKLDNSLVVLCDQGLGDHIQFARYLPFLKEKVSNLYVATRKTLKSLFEKNYPDIKFINFEEVDPNMQSIKITDIAYVLEIYYDKIPFAEGYLKSDIIKIESDKPKVGLCWEAGGTGIRGLLHRTINIKSLEAILNVNNIQLYSFQVNDKFDGCKLYPHMIDLGKDFKTFEDTAKAMKSMDLMITVDTSVAHLAGALGVKTFLMLPYSSDWRWFNETKSTPWYNSIEIFKQDDPISWEKPIKDILCRLKEYSL